MGFGCTGTAASLPEGIKKFIQQKNVNVSSDKRL
jgi:hypothetical protein